MSEGSWIESKAEPRKVWAVSSGSYSDYTVEFICETEEMAQAFVRAIADRDRYGEYYVEPMELYPESSDPQPRIRFVAQGELGSMDIEVREYTGSYGHYGKRPKMRQQLVMGREGETIAAEGGDREACVKAVKDRLAAHIARGDA